MLAHVNDYDAILLDLMLPKKNGLQVASELRREGRRTPILMLTARGAAEDIVRGLDVGADDYLTKPFKFEVLLARVRALVRRGGAAAASGWISRRASFKCSSTSCCIQSKWCAERSSWRKCGTCTSIRRPMSWTCTWRTSAAS